MYPTVNKYGRALSAWMGVRSSDEQAFRRYQVRAVLIRPAADDPRHSPQTRTRCACPDGRRAGPHVGMADAGAESPCGPRLHGNDRSRGIWRIGSRLSRLLYRDRGTFRRRRRGRNDRPCPQSGRRTCHRKKRNRRAETTTSSSAGIGREDRRFLDHRATGWL